jgi:hypothetical protein
MRIVPLPVCKPILHIILLAWYTLVALLTITRLFVNDQENVPTPEYLTLGYHWGKNEFPCLTKGALSTFIERIDVNALPATL